jgi:hypothetical protein
MTEAGDRDTTPPRANPSVGRLLLGAASLAGERLRLTGRDRSSTASLVVGLISDGRDAVSQAVSGLATGARESRPATRVRGALDQARGAIDQARGALDQARGALDQARDAIDHARGRGHDLLAGSREETDAWLHDVMQRSLAWAGHAIVPPVMDNATPYVTREFVPKVIEAVMPQIRATVVPAIIEDLTTDPRVRVMIAEQSHGAVAAAADELRKVTSTADDQVESAFRRTFHRHSTP